MTGSDLLELLERAARDYPERGFRFFRRGSVVTETLSYRELRDEARGMKLGVPPGARALLLYEPGLSFVKAYWGCLYAGVTPVPAPFPRPQRLARTLPQLERIARDCAPALVLSSSPVPGLVVEPGPPLEGLAFLQYTSGSTREPRGVMVSHGNVLANLEMLRQFHRCQEHMVMVHWLPWHHDMGLVRGMLSPVHMAADCYVMDPLEFVQRPGRWLSAISAFGATTTGAPNFGYELAARKAEGEFDLSSLRVAFCSAEPIRKATVDRFLARFSSAGLSPGAFKPAYGLAEATVAVTGEMGERYRHRTVSVAALRQGRVAEPAGPEDAQDLVCCGQALEGLEVVVEEGEILVRGPSVASGYWGRPPFEGPFLRTGDLGFLDADGGLYVTGRKKDLLIVRGQNYHPQDLEAAVEEAVPELRPGCTVAFEVEGTVVVACEARYQEVVALRVVEAVGEEFGLAVSAVVFLPSGGSLKTASGKLQRAATRDRFVGGTLGQVWSRRGGA